MSQITCFKAYDIRGRVPDELNEDIAYRIGRACAEFLKPSKVIIGRDVRLSSEALSAALARGLTDAGVDVFDLGLCGTEEVYFSTFNNSVDGGIMVTASHNPGDFNGMKLVREGSKPVSSDTGLLTIKKLAEEKHFPDAEAKGTVSRLDDRTAYIRHLLGYIDTHSLKPFRVVVNAGNGCAGPVIDLLAEHLPFEFIRVNHGPDGTFPSGIPNPLLPENRAATIKAVLDNKADVGIAWDGDFDRCFFFDEKGGFIEGYYIVGLLASAALLNHPRAKIIHDPRLTWNTIDLVSQAGGVPVQSKTGHAFIKERMRTEDAVYGGEMSGHHYFRDFAYCDSGMVPWLLVLEMMSRSGKPLSELVSERVRLFPSSGEINRKVGDAQATINRIEENYLCDVLTIDNTDGLSMEFKHWRFNLRPSNTEPVLRLNVESKGDKGLMLRKTEEILSLIDNKKPPQFSFS